MSILRYPPVVFMLFKIASVSNSLSCDATMVFIIFFLVPLSLILSQSKM